MENALSYITVLPSTKQEMAVFVSKAIDEALSGTRNPLEIESQLKKLEDLIKAIRANSDYKYAVMDEAGKYHEKSFTAFGSKITKAVKTTYDFKACNDPVYNQLTDELAKLKEVIKAREQVLKTGVDPSTGETFNPPTSETTEYLTIVML
jgi:hypothetical protein